MLLGFMYKYRASSIMGVTWFAPVTGRHYRATIGPSTTDLRAVQDFYRHLKDNKARHIKYTSVQQLEILTLRLTVPSCIAV